MSRAVDGELNRTTLSLGWVPGFLSFPEMRTKTAPKPSAMKLEHTAQLAHDGEEVQRVLLLKQLVRPRRGGERDRIEEWAPFAYHVS